MQKSNQCPNGWMQTVLGNVGDVSMCKRVLKHQTANFGEVPFFKIGTFGGVPDAYISQDLFNEYKQKYSYPKNGEVLISAAGTIGRLVTFDGIDAYFQDSNIVWIANDEKIALNKYLYYLYQTIRWRTSEGGIVSRLYNTEIRKTKICLPPLEEQEKIAQILATWDSAIEQLTDLIAEKQHQKKALMQRFVFSRSNTKSFKIHELFELGRGRVISKEEISKNSGFFPVYSSQTSNDGVLGYLNTYDFSGDYITWTTDGANAGRVFYRSGKFNCTNVCGIAKSKRKDIVNLYYVMCYLNYVTKYYVSYVGNPKLMNGVFSEIEIRLPPVSEQKAIADVLMAADTEIDLLQQQLQAITEQKQGLMQQLLTGNIRVKIDKKS